MQTVVRGMVQVDSITYRIVRFARGTYEVVRLLDDQKIGTFTLAGNRGVFTDAEGRAADIVREVGRLALQSGRTSWAPRFATPR